MADDRDTIQRNATEARAGATPHMTRYILPASTALVIIAFVLIWMFV